MNRRAFIQINGETLPIDQNDYKINYPPVETDRFTENGRVSREIVRTDRVVITTNFTVTKPWIAKLKAYKDTPVLNVTYYEPETGLTGTAEAFVSNYVPSLAADNGVTPLFNIAMTIEGY